MQPRIEAAENLRWVQILTVASPDCEPGYRKAMLNRWTSIANGIDPDYDESGRFIITSGAALRRWFRVEGFFAEDEIGEPIVGGYE